MPVQQEILRRRIEANKERIPGPQAGPQEQFLKTKADIAIYGGAAGGGKSWALLLEPLRHIEVKGFGGVIFRRTTVQIRNEGALWDESAKMYPLVGGDPKSSTLWWEFPEKTSISFAGLEYDSSVNDWQGAQIPFIGFDELTHFTAKQFWYMVSRNRSMCGVKPYIRATCNPDADSWVATFISWWIDQNTGFAIPERSGVLRWFIRVNDELIWGDSKEELEAAYPGALAKSVTFIPASLDDNPALNAADPGYRANLMALPRVERERLLRGNWKIRAAAGLLFQRAWCKVVDHAPEDLEEVRGWDLAGTPKTLTNDPDFTAGTKIGRSRSTGRYIVLDHRRKQDTPAKIETFVQNTASDDGISVAVSIAQDPAQAGKSQALAYVKLLEGYSVYTSVESGDKETRFGPFSAQAENGFVDVLRGDWNEIWFDSLEAFPDAAHDDDADSTSRAFNHFLARKKGWAMLELTRRDAEQTKAEQKPEPAKPEAAAGSLEAAKALMT